MTDTRFAHLKHLPDERVIHWFTDDEPVVCGYCNGFHADSVCPEVGDVA